MITLLIASDVLTFTVPSPPSVKVFESERLLQAAPVPDLSVGKVYLPLLFAPTISTFVIVLFHDRFCPTLKRTAVRAWRKVRSVRGAAPIASKCTLPEQAVIKSF